MSRDDGFPIADVDTGLLGDPKVRRLVRTSKDRQDAATTLLLYVSLILESWEHGERVTFDDGAPLWWIGEDDADRLAALQRVGLLDQDGMIPERSWESWYGPARDRREVARIAGREGNRRRWDRSANGSGSGSDSGTDRVPIGKRSPSVPSNPTNRPPRATAREKRAPRSLGDVIGEMEI